MRWMFNWDVRRFEHRSQLADALLLLSLSHAMSSIKSKLNKKTATTTTATSTFVHILHFIYVPKIIAFENGACIIPAMCSIVTILCNIFECIFRRIDNQPVRLFWFSFTNWRCAHKMLTMHRIDEQSFRYIQLIFLQFNVKFNDLCSASFIIDWCYSKWHIKLLWMAFAFIFFEFNFHELQTFETHFCHFNRLEYLLIQLNRSNRGNCAKLQVIIRFVCLVLFQVLFVRQWPKIISLYDSFNENLTCIWKLWNIFKLRYELAEWTLWLNVESNDDKLMTPSI